MADKKITELPFITDVTASVGDTATTRTVIPVVLYGTTNQITADNLKDNFIREVRSTVAGLQTYTSSLKGAATVVGNGLSVAGNLEVGGMITAQQYNVTYVSSSVQYQSGSTEFGDTVDDTHTFTGTLILNGLAIGTAQLMAQTASQNAINIGISSVTGSMNTQSSSQDLVNRGISSVTGSINTTTSSFNSVFLGISSVTGAMNTTTSSFNSVFQRISSTTGSINTTTSSFDSVFFGISSVTGAMNTQSSSQDLVNRQISLVSGSIHFTTGALNSFTGSIIGQTNTIATFTSSVNFTTQSLNTQTGSQNSLNTSLGLITSSIYGEITSFNSVFQRIGSTTSSMNTQSGSQDLVNLGISTYTGSQNVINTSVDVHILKQATQTGSQDLVNYNISVVTSSIDSHILKQATQTGSQDLVNLGISSVTGSLIGITNGLMAFTAALDETYATDAQLYQLYQATASLNTQTGSQDLVNLGISTYTGSQNVINNSVNSHILVQSTQTGSQDLVNFGISTFTGSLRSEVNLIEAYTASLKGAAIVSSSQQILNYNIFATTGSNIFVGNQTISGSFLVSGSTTQIGNNTLDGNTVLSGSISVTGSQLFIGTQTLSGSFLISGSTSQFGNNTLVGNNTITGSNSLLGNNIINGTNTIKGNTVLSGSIEVSGSFTGSVDIAGDLNIASGSGFYRWGNKLFNYGQWSSLETQTGSANTAYAMKMEVPVPEFEGIYVGNNGSGFPTRIYVENNGLYNIQFSAQLHTTANESCDFSVWFAMTGSNIVNSNTDFSIEKVSGGGFSVAALNFLTPISSGSYVELYWSKTTANGQLQYKGTQTTPTRPATPSIIVTVTQIA